MENRPTNHLILSTSCQITKQELERSFIPSDYQYYFRIFDRSLSSSFLSLLPLSFCKYQQTTYYSSSGFDIFRSLPHFLVTGIVNSQKTSSFHDKNAVFSFIDQPIPKSSGILMSPNESNLSPNSELNRLTTTTTTTATATTTINSLLSTTTTATSTSNVSLFHTSLSTTQQGANRTFNLTLLIGCISASVILIIIIIFAFIKYRNRDEGSYKIDESKNFVLTPHTEKQDKSGCGGKISSSHNYRQKLIPGHEQNGIDSREWYV